LYDLGMVHWYMLDDKANGERYFRLLIAEYPSDDLSIFALAMLGEWKPGGNPPKESITNKVQCALLQNFPNPFNPSTTIQYQLPEPGLVKLVVYDVLGREVATLVDEYKPAGSYSVKFDGSNLASGIYFFKFAAGEFVQVNKMLLAR